MPKPVICMIAIAAALASHITTSAAENTEWDRTVLPRPPQPPDAPNILLVLIDDAGFGNPSTFGGPVATPTLDKLAADISDEIA